MQNWAGYAQMGSSLLNASSSVKSGNQTASVYNQQAKQLRQQANNVDAAYQQQAREQTTKPARQNQHLWRTLRPPVQTPIACQLLITALISRSRVS
jgi:regulatory protein YycH of two-component signal transduction system YycFG